MKNEPNKIIQEEASFVLICLLILAVIFVWKHKELAEMHQSFKERAKIEIQDTTAQCNCVEPLEKTE